jgi:hypothetical protein
VVLDGSCMHAVDSRQELLVGLGGSKLQGALLIERNHRDMGADVGKELRLPTLWASLVLPRALAEAIDIVRGRSTS